MESSIKRNFLGKPLCGTHVPFSRQGKKFKDKLPAQPGPIDDDFDDSSDDSTGSHGASEQFLRPRRHSDRAGEGFVSSIRGLFNLQRRKAKALVLRTRRGPEELDFEQRSSSSDDEGNPTNAANPTRSPRAITGITKAKRLLRLQARRHKVNRLPRGQFVYHFFILGYLICFFGCVKLMNRSLLEVDACGLNKV